MEQIAGAFAGLALAYGIIAIITTVREGKREARMWAAVSLIALVLCIGMFAIDFAMYMSEHGA